VVSIPIPSSLTHSTAGVTQEPPQGSCIWLFGAPEIPVSTENSESMQKSSDLSCPAIVSRACSHSSRRFFHGSLVGFAAARNWSSSSLLRHQLAVLHRQRSWSPPALGARSPILDLALPGLAAVPEHYRVGEARHRGPMALQRLPALLALTLEAWAAVSSSRIRDLIRQMNNANPLWGAPRIHGELLKLGIKVSQATVAKYMVRRVGRPSPAW
jgi:hypothetical protein